MKPEKNKTPYLPGAGHGERKRAWKGTEVDGRLVNLLLKHLVTFTPLICQTIVQLCRINPILLPTYRLQLPGC